MNKKMIISYQNKKNKININLREHKNYTQKNKKMKKENKENQIELFKITITRNREETIQIYLIQKLWNSLNESNILFP